MAGKPFCRGCGIPQAPGAGPYAARSMRTEHGERCRVQEGPRPALSPGKEGAIAYAGAPADREDSGAPVVPSPGPAYRTRIFFAGRGVWGRWGRSLSVSFRFPESGFFLRKNGRRGARPCFPLPHPWNRAGKPFCGGCGIPRGPGAGPYAARSMQTGHGSGAECRKGGGLPGGPAKRAR